MAFAIQRQKHHFFKTLTTSSAVLIAVFSLTAIIFSILLQEDKIMTTKEELLERSIEHYKVILETMQSLKAATKHVHPEEIQNFAIVIKRAQKKTHLIEQELDKFLTQTPEIQQSPRFRTRLTLIEQILELNKKCNSRIKTLMVINRNDFKKISSGLTVMNTYQSSSEHQIKGGLINSSS